MNDIPSLNELLTRLRKIYHRLLISKSLKHSFILLTGLILAGLAFALLSVNFPQNPTVRFIFLFTYIAAGTAYLVQFVVIPVFKRLGIIHVFIYEEVVPIVNQKFHQLKDSLTNLVELLESDQKQIVSRDLYHAALKEKAIYARQFPLEQTVNFRENLQYAALFFLSALIALSVYFFSTDTLNKGLSAFLQPALIMESHELYQYAVINDSLAVGRGDDITVKVAFSEEKVPSKLYLHAMGNNLRMSREDKGTFSYTFNAVNNPVDFYLSDGKWNSKSYQIKVLPKPALNKFSVHVDVPDYTGKEDFEKQNSGNLNLPEGSRVTWRFSTTYVDSLKLTLGGKDTVLADSNQAIRYSQTFTRSADYTIGLKNAYFTDSSVIKYNIRVAGDQFPEIVAEEQKDSLNPSIRYFHGNISDDYGFSRLNLIIRPQKKQQEDSVFRVPINPNIDYQEFYFSYNFEDLNKEVNRYNYFFEVYDNDQINGPKSAKSSIFTYEIMQREELDSIQNKRNQQMANSMEKGMKVAQDLQEQLDELKNQSLSDNVSSWERNKLLKNIENKQKELKKLLNQTKELSKEKRQAEQQNTEKDKELLEKQKQLEQLMDELMTDEMKKLLEEIQKLREEFNKKNMQKLQENMEFTYEEMEKQLDRNLELMKKLQVEEQLNSVSESLKQLGEKQEELEQQTGDGTLSDEELQEEQQKLEEEFKQVEQKLEETNSLNEKLEFPYKLSDFKEERRNIQKNFEQIQEQSDKPFGKKKMQEMQQENAGDMKKLGQSIQSMLQQNMQQMTQLNKKNLRQILSNLLKFSFDNEQYIEKLGSIRRNNPKYVDLLKDQKKLERNFTIVRDSLYALSKKSFQLDKPINDEVISISRNFSDLISLLEERKVNVAKTKQRKILTSSNNLALFLSEILDNMRNSMGQGSGSGQPKKGGKSKPSISQMKNIQQGLKKQLQQMMEQMKKQGKGGPKMSKQLAKMLSQQEKFQRKLQEMRKNGNMSKDMREILRQIEQMSEEVKNDIIEKEIRPETIERQNKIMTRLLDAEDADRKQDIEKKREAKSAKQRPMSNPDSIFPYNENEETFTEKLRLHRLQLSDFYDEKYKFYLQGIGQ